MTIREEKGRPLPDPFSRILPAPNSLSCVSSRMAAVQDAETAYPLQGDRGEDAPGQVDALTRTGKPVIETTGGNSLEAGWRGMVMI